MTLKVVVPVPLISRAPLCRIAPVVAVAVRFPPTVEVERVIVLLLVNVALPEVPEVFKLTAPVNEFDVLSRVIA